MKTLKKFAAILAALALVIGIPATNLQAQDSSVQVVTYFDGKGLIKSQSGGAPVFSLRTRVTIAQVNAGLTLLPALAGYKYRIVDIWEISVGGTVGTCTTVDILGTQATSSVKLLASAAAALAQNALLRAGATNATILAAGASFVANDTATAITIGKTGGTCDTATHVDVQLFYVIEAA